jgi:hypothetical protein
MNLRFGSICKDVYFVREGRSSIDAIVLFGSLLAIGGWGAAAIDETGLQTQATLTTHEDISRIRRLLGP